MSSEPDMGTHGTLQVELVANLPLSCMRITFGVPISIDSFFVARTQICSLQCLVGKPDLKPTTVLLSIEPRNGEASPVHRDRIANMAVSEDWCCI